MTHQARILLPGTRFGRLVIVGLNRRTIEG